MMRREPQALGVGRPAAPTRMVVPAGFPVRRPCYCLHRARRSAFSREGRPC